MAKTPRHRKPTPRTDTGRLDAARHLTASPTGEQPPARSTRDARSARSARSTRDAHGERNARGRVSSEVPSSRSTPQRQAPSQPKPRRERDSAARPQAKRPTPRTQPTPPKRAKATRRQGSAAPAATKDSAAPAATKGSAAPAATKGSAAPAATKATKATKVRKIAGAPDPAATATKGVSANGRRTKLLVGGVAALAAVVAIVLIALALIPKQPPLKANEPDVPTAPLLDADADAEAEKHLEPVSLSAVGDNLMHMPVVYTADAAEGTMDDGLYDFGSLYAGIKDIVDTHDINFIDIETPMGGDERGLSGYPSFNTPSDDAADIAAFGFNLATTATNHAWDQGLEGIKSMAETWAAHPEVIVAGTYTDQADRDRVRTFQKNGITFAFLAYQDYLNGYELPEDTKWAIADSNDREAVKADLDRAHELADCVIVAMSWGDEYAFEPNQSQRDTAQFFADNGVDLVLGFGAHVIEPVEWVSASATAEGEEEPHKTLVVFSLGNFVSNQQDPFNNVEGCFTCDIALGEDNAPEIQNPTWIPLVNHFSGGTGHRVYQLKDYTEELARTHDILGGLDDPLGYVRDLTAEVIDPEVVTIAM